MKLLKTTPRFWYILVLTEIAFFAMLIWWLKGASFYGFKIF